MIYTATKYKTGGKCGHNHETVEAKDNCQRQLSQAGAARASGRATRSHKGGGRGKKYGSKCK